MKKYRKNIFAAMTSVFLIISYSPLAVYAANTHNAKTLLDTGRKCSLNVSYKYEDENFSGIDVKLYQFAYPDEKAKFTLCGDFSNYQFSINGLSSQSEWNTLATTLGSYITADGIKPSYTAKTNSEGTASFSGLPCGLYLAGKVTQTQDDTVTEFSPFVIALPQLNDSNNWVYSSDVHTKGVRSIKSSELQKLHVIKEWKDFPEYRPDSVTADIYRNGELAESVILSEKNNWMYEWNADISAEWNVVERFIPGGYDVEIMQNDNSFFIINTLWPIGGDEDDDDDNDEDDDDNNDDDDNTDTDDDDDSGSGEKSDSNITTPNDDSDEHTTTSRASDGSSSKTTTKNKKNSSDSSLPDTGDSFSVIPYVSCIFGSLSLYGILSFIEKRRRHEENK